jgi:Domain of unknown function (DUF4389)
MRTARVPLAIVGAVVAAFGLVLLVGGAVLLWANATERDADGFFTSRELNLESGSFAVTTPHVDLGAAPADWFPTGRLATVRLEAESPTGPVFLGVGPAADVEAYLQGVPVSQVRHVDGRGTVDYEEVGGTATPAAPGDQGFWVASASGDGPQSIVWDVASADSVVVVMNADASPGISVTSRSGARSDVLLWAAAVLLVVGVVSVVVAAAMFVAAGLASGPGPGPGSMTVTAAGHDPGAGDPAVAGGSYPLRLEGRLDPELSRWVWLVKWVLLVPHLVVLAFLWVGYLLGTIVAFVAILLTGRYPSAVFDFNVGVLRWTWRVAFYGYWVNGTDQYPPFTLRDVEYPATLDVAAPGQLSRGLVLVKWWLLALPQYVIVGLFCTGAWWWATRLGPDNRAAGASTGLVEVLVLVSVVTLAVTGAYPRGLFDLVLGLNRWVFRVLAYAGLMTDDYPPFRLDVGDREPTPTGSRPSGRGHPVPTA